MVETKPSTPRLSELARHLVIPEGITASAWPRIADRLDDIGVAFDPWQASACQVALGRDTDGLYAATIGGVVWSIPRQVGKTFTVGSLLVALALEYPGLRVVWTSHHLRTTTNTFRSMQSLVRRKGIVGHLAPNGIRVANGEQEIRFANGSIIMFGAREQGFGRGMDAIDLLIFDEAQKLGQKALEDMIPATNAARHEHGALLFFLGTPPRPVDDGEAFMLKRSTALAGRTKSTMYLEFSADPDGELDDREQWARANPSFPKRTSMAAMQRMRENLGSDEAWAREALGIWDSVAAKGVIPLEALEECGDVHSVPTSRFALGVEVGPDLGWASVVLAGRRDDGLWHFEVDEDQHTKGVGVGWLEAYLAKVVEANPQIRSVAVDVKGPIMALLEQRGNMWRFRDSGLRVDPITVDGLGSMTAAFMSRVVMGELRFIPTPQVMTAAQAAGKRPLGDTGRWVFSRRSATSDITQVQAAILALWAAEKGAGRSPVPQKQLATSGRRGFVG